MNTCFFPAIVLTSAIVAGPAARAEVRLPAIFSDHMILQQDESAAVWGWAEPGEKVDVTIGGETKSTTAGDDKKWSVKLDKLPRNTGPQTLIVQGKNTLTVKDVLVGEVWLASGQSNMAFPVQNAQDFEKEKAAATFPLIRMFTVATRAQRTPQADCKGAWVVCSPETVGRFSAVAYFFGRELHRKLGAPVGLVNSSVGGTDIAAWTSEEVQLKNPETKAFFDSWMQRDAQYDSAAAKTANEQAVAKWQEQAEAAKAAGTVAPLRPKLKTQPQNDPNFPANLYNGMIAPILPYTLRGVIWYQGEHNSADEARAMLYRQQLPMLIADWRQRWGSELPFAWVQLPGLGRAGEGRAVVREAMLQTLRVPQTGMAVTIDIGEKDNNHPKNKQDVGQRLGWWALGSVYGEKVPATSGPLLAKHEIQGSEVTLTFAHTEGGLVAKDGDLRGFVLAGADGKWAKANARLAGDKVVISHPDVPKPIAARYAWAGNPDGNLFNGAGLPASPFRTDQP